MSPIILAMDQIPPVLRDRKQFVGWRWETRNGARSKVPYTIEGVRAIQACLRADVEIVLMSGRRQAQVKEDARLFGQTAYIYEAGACLVLDAEEHWLTGGMVPG